MSYISFTRKTTAVAMLLLSTTGIVHAKHHMTSPANYKGDYKNEAPCPPPKSLKGGFYVGAQLGYDMYSVQTTSYALAPASLTTSANSSGQGWVGGGFLGYGQYFDNYYYLAAEAFGNGSAAQSTFSVRSTAVPGIAASSKISVNGNYGVSALPGLKLNDAVLAYVRLGYNWASLKLSGNINTPTFYSASSSKTVGGFNYGVGLESLVFEDFSVRAEYDRTDFNSLNISGYGGSANAKPADNQFMVGVLYHFA